MNVNQVSVTFSEDVEVAPSDLLMKGVNAADYPTSGPGTSFVYDDATNTATWTLPQALPKDKLLLHVTNLVPDSDGERLGVYQLRINALPGDADRSGRVNAIDQGRVKARENLSTTSPGTSPTYTPYDDVDASGTITGDPGDGGHVKANLNATLPTAEPTPPAFAAVPSGLSATAASANVVNLSWTDNASDESGYLIELSLGGTTFHELATVGPAAGIGAYLFGEAFPHLEQYFRVAAVNAAGRSDYSAPDSALTHPPAPEGVTLDQVTNSRIDLSWNTVPGLSAQTLEWRQGGGGWNSVGLSGSAASYSHTGLTDGTLYEYQLRASNSAGASAPSELTGAYTLPAAPSGLVARKPTDPQRTSDQIDLEWSNNATATTAIVVEGMTHNGDWREFTTLAPNATTASITQLANGTLYNFRVLARNESGDSQPSGNASAATDLWTITNEATQAGLAVNMGANRLEYDDQPPGVHGAYVQLAPASSYSVGFNYDLSTWDSYNQPGGDGTGYWDSFSVSLTDQPYPQLQLEDPLTYPFVWGGTSFTDHNLESTGGTRTVTLTGDPAKAMYLNVVLDTNTTIDADQHYASWGTIAVTAPTTLPTLARVNVRASKPQAAEGGTAAAQGEFTFYRDGGDASGDLTVTFTVATGSGHATSGFDYNSIGTSVVIPAGQRKITVPVTGMLDADAAEGNETVRVTITDSPNQYKLGHSTAANVTILDRKKYFVYFYGLAGPETFGDPWLDKLGETQQSRGYTLLGDIGPGGFAENRGSRALRAFFQEINADGGKTISIAEAESADLKAAGWSLGASQGVNFTYYLSRADTRIADYKLSAKVPVEALVTWDPGAQLKVGAAFIGAAKTLRTVQDNVQEFSNYYQRRTGSTSFQRLDAAGAVVGLERFNRGVGDAFIVGNTVPTNLPAGRAAQVRVDVDLANEPEERDRINAFGRVEADPLYNGGVDEPRYRLFGNASVRVGVHHSTLTWYAWRRSIDDLA